ncbi:FMN-binding negative transcriptional regulator [Marmoricola endophyticus]|uniref:FMN-binding negative transcriptional regulator n=1 Tax=Marmoricola endophyticus TaxID=2040280 RepID=UPI00166D29E7|nr:FMN-binding negative transcriptional regulator [Marmoricola endophyticus]
MYVPPANAVSESDLRAMVRAARTAQLVTVGPDGVPLATLLPVLWREDVVVAHMALANEHWRSIPETDGAPALVVCTLPDAYVSPSWYAAKAEHGRVVPTWNYSAVHLTGTARVVRDVDWLRDAVTGLTDHHEAGRVEPWAVADAPVAFTEGQLRGIVGVEVRVERAEGKAKLSQNRSEADRAGVVGGLRDEAPAVAAAVAAGRALP